MAKRRRRDQQHLGQESQKRRTYVAGGASAGEKYKPGFPMNIVSNTKIFYVVGAFVAVIMVATMVIGAQQVNSSPDPDDVDLGTPTPTVDPNASPTPTATPDPKKFSAADQVIDAAVNDYRAIIKTTMGDFTIDLLADQSPATVNSFVFLAQKDYFDNTPIHRVRADFVIQAGDPTGTGTGGPGYTTAEDTNELRNTRGMVSWAKGSGQTVVGSQWFVNLKDNSSLDFDNGTANKYYPFGEVVEGMDVVDKISQVPVERAASGEISKPVDEILITDVVIEVSKK